jgi:hypothetical protein
MKIFYSKNGLKELYGLCGIYFLVHQKEIEYIGRSVNIGNRLMSHHVFDRKHHDEILVCEIPFEYRWKLKNIELDFIHDIMPVKNINGTINQTIIQTGKHINRRR